MDKQTVIVVEEEEEIKVVDNNSEYIKSRTEQTSSVITNEEDATNSDKEQEKNELFEIEEISSKKGEEKIVQDPEELKKFLEKKRKIEENLVKYCLKFFVYDNILDISFNISTENYMISRRLYIPDYIDLNLFILVINEIFEWEGRSWQLNVKNFKLSSSPDIKEVLYETEKTKKYYNILDVKLNKLKFVKDEKFNYIYDKMCDVWNVNCKVEYVYSVKELISRQYKNERDRMQAFKRLKSLFRPILLKGEGIYPPDDLGGQKAFKTFLKNRIDQTNEIVIKYVSYYKSLIGEDEEDNQDDEEEKKNGKEDKIAFYKRDIIEEYLSCDFDFIELQKSLGSIEYIKFYDKDATYITKKTEHLSQITDIQSLQAYDYEYEFDDEEEEEVYHKQDRDERDRDNNDVKSLRARETERDDKESKYENYTKIQKFVDNNHIKSENNNDEIRVNTNASKSKEILQTSGKNQNVETVGSKKNKIYNNSGLYIETSSSKKNNPK